MIRCRNYQASLAFYGQVLGFRITEQWDERGDVGCIFAPAGDSSVGCIEIYGMSEDDARFVAAYSQPLPNDKLDLQLRTPDLQSWIDHLNDRWPFSEPETMPWGHRWIKLRDPDNLLVVVYEVTA